jgi:hypothetical protein
MAEATRGKKVPRPPPRCYLEAALDYLIEDAQKNMTLDGTASLEAEEIIREHVVGPPRRIKVVMARGEIPQGGIRRRNTAHSPPQSSPVEADPGEAHTIDHGGVETMTMRS